MAVMCGGFGVASSRVLLAPFFTSRVLTKLGVFGEGLRTVRHYVCETVGLVFPANLHNESQKILLWLDENNVSRTKDTIFQRQALHVLIVEQAF